MARTSAQPASDSLQAWWVPPCWWQDRSCGARLAVDALTHAAQCSCRLSRCCVRALPRSFPELTMSPHLQACSILLTQSWTSTSLLLCGWLPRLRARSRPSSAASSSSQEAKQRQQRTARLLCIMTLLGRWSLPAACLAQTGQGPLSIATRLPALGQAAVPWTARPLFSLQGLL